MIIADIAKHCEQHSRLPAVARVCTDCFWLKGPEAYGVLVSMLNKQANYELSSKTQGDMVD